MTGRGAGDCAGNPAPGFGGGGWGRGFRFRGGGGRGFRNRFRGAGWTGWQRAGLGPLFQSPYTSGPNREQELAALKGQAENLQTSLEEVRKRILELDSEENKNG